ncbi:MAG: hypothetical protein EOP07_20205 [Proteobacteria bacterium]|nr:MAG: hypothetical protein EOP07_20205 [Pseudomonadota bacterium]
MREQEFEGKKSDVRMFEYLELRSSVLINEVNQLLTRLRQEACTGLEWRRVCERLEAKQQELELLFSEIRAEIVLAAEENASRERMMRHLELTVGNILHS